MPDGGPDAEATGALSGAVPDGRGLYVLRKRINDACLAAVAARPVLAVLYGSDRPDARAEDDLASSQALAAARAWEVRDRYTDITIGPDPTERPGWNRVRAAIRSERAHGVVACCQAAVSRNTSVYRDQLRWLELHQAALWLVHPETAS
jgi:hypothetical protein